jgi:hypothetical protein
MDTINNTPETPPSIKRDWVIAGGAAAGFFALLKGAGWVDQNFDFSAIFNLIDFYTVALKVAIASALAWSIKKFVFSNTLGKDFGITFDAGWNEMNSIEKTRWTLVLFSALFITIMFSF